MKLLPLLSLSLLLPACLGWVQPTLVKTRYHQVGVVASAHKDTFEEINQELHELGNDIQSQIKTEHGEGMDEYHESLAHKLRKELHDTQKQLVTSRAKVRDLETKLTETHERLEDLRVVYKVTEREVLLGQRNRKKELNSVKFLLRSLVSLVGRRLQNGIKMVTRPRWRLHARRVRKDQANKKSDE